MEGVLVNVNEASEMVFFLSHRNGTAITGVWPLFVLPCKFPAPDVVAQLQGGESKLTSFPQKLPCLRYANRLRQSAHTLLPNKVALTLRISLY